MICCDLGLIWGGLAVFLGDLGFFWRGMGWLGRDLGRSGSCPGRDLLRSVGDLGGLGREPWRSGVSMASSWAAWP